MSLHCLNRTEGQLRYYSSSCMEGLRKTMKSLSHDIRPLRRDFNPRPLEYEASMITMYAVKIELVFTMK